MPLELIIPLMFLCLIMEGFFSGSEIGVVSADRLKLRHMAAQGNSGAKLAVEMLSKPEWLLSTTLVGTNIAIVTNTTLATVLSVQVFGPKYSWMAIPIVAPLIWIFGEIVPKSIFQQRADVLTPKVIFILKGASIIFFPILVFFTTLTKLLTKMVGKKEKNPFTLREELDLMLQMDGSDSDISAMEKNMIRRTFDYGRTQARDIMIPYLEVSTVANTTSCRETLNVAGESAHPLIPIYDGRVDRVVGQINTMDLLGQPDDTPIKSFIKPIRFIYGSKKLEDLMEQFRKDGDRMAIVVDEFGSAEGLVTMKDIVERIVGYYEDEHGVAHHSDRVDQEIVKIKDGEYLVNGRLTLMALKQVTGIDLESGQNNYETLSGFLLEQFGDIPTHGNTCEFEGNRFTVEGCNDKRIEVVRINLP